jgi:hypothetical protein
MSIRITRPVVGIDLKPVRQPKATLAKMIFLGTVTFRNCRYGGLSVVLPAVCLLGAPENRRNRMPLFFCRQVLPRYSLMST